MNGVDTMMGPSLAASCGNNGNLHQDGAAAGTLHNSLTPDSSMACSGTTDTYHPEHNH
jgi:hypothetical protein